MTLSKERLLGELPLHERSLRIRPSERADLDILAAWPEYPKPFQHFRFSFAALAPVERDALFCERERRADRISLVADCDDTRAIGYIALLEIDWHKAKVGNMSARVHPAWCGRGIGSLMLSLVSDWCIGNGIRSLRLDVAAANQRAVRCYEKAGFDRCGEFWRKDEGLEGIDLSAEEYDGIREHVRLRDRMPESRFWWMERNKA